MIRGLLFWIAVISFPVPSESAYLRNVPVTVRQPDGQVLHCLASGDEFHNWLHDKDGFTIMQDPTTGFYVYAAKTGSGLAATALVAGRSDPVKAGLPTNVNLSPEEVKAKIASLPQRNPLTMTGRVNAPQTGVINNIVIFIRFSDEAEFTDPVTLYDAKFNGSSAGESSVYNYFREASYNQLSISTTFYPAPSGTVVSYQDVQPRAYYQPYNAVTNPDGYQTDYESTTREHTLLKNAIDAVSAQIDPSLVVDADGDGDVDNVCFIVEGGPDGWSDLLWPHMWSLYTQTALINGKTVGTYNFQLQASVGVGVLCHEMFHSLGAPDLYHYSQDFLSPVWKWDIMEWDLDPPQHMGAYMKFQYGKWISAIPQISASGTYTLNPLTSSTNNAWRINSPNSLNEYFVLEYRRRTGTFEGSLPGEGLLVYRINPLVTEGNRNGPPDEVYIYRPGGTLADNGNPLLAPFSVNSGRTVMDDITDPSGFLSDGTVGGLNISNVTAIGSTISFTYAAAEPPPAACLLTKCSTTTALVSDINPSSEGQLVTFTATVSSAEGVPTGTVLFYSDGVPLGSAVMLVSGTAALSSSALAAGDHAVMAVYGGSSSFSSSSDMLDGVQHISGDQSGVCAEKVSDGSFESGTPSAWWAETSTNFGTPLCDASCGYALARSGNWYAWFGGTPVLEAGTLSQSVTLSAGVAQALQFYLWIPWSSGNRTDFLKVKIDGNEVFSVLEGASAYEAGYVPVTVDLSPYTDGNSHIVLFESSITGSPQSTSFVVDDVSIRCAPSTLISSDHNPAAAGQLVTFTATVTGGGGVPGGTVQFSLDGLPFGSPVALDLGIASLGIPNLDIGIHALSAVYSGNAKFIAGEGELPGGQVVTLSGTCDGPARIGIVDYPLIMGAPGAYAAAGGGQEIRLREGEFTEDLIFARGIAFALTGGYGCGFFTNSGPTVIHGRLEIIYDTVTVSGLVLQ